MILSKILQEKRKEIEERKRLLSPKDLLEKVSKIYIKSSFKKNSQDNMQFYQCSDK